MNFHTHTQILFGGPTSAENTALLRSTPYELDYSIYLTVRIHIHIQYTLLMITNPNLRQGI